MEQSWLVGTIVVLAVVYLVWYAGFEVLPRRLRPSNLRPDVGRNCGSCQGCRGCRDKRS